MQRRRRVSIRPGTVLSKVSGYKKKRARMEKAFARTRSRNWRENDLVVLFLENDCRLVEEREKRWCQRKNVQSLSVKGGQVCCRPIALPTLIEGGSKP